MCTHYVKIDDALGAPGGVRTRDRRINNPLFMPLNYGGVESSEGSGGNVPRRCYRRSPASDLLVTAPPSHRRRRVIGASTFLSIALSLLGVDQVTANGFQSPMMAVNFHVPSPTCSAILSVRRMSFTFATLAASSPHRF